MATAGWVSLEEAQKRVLGTPIDERSPQYFSGLFKALKELLPEEFPPERCHTYRSLPRLLAAGTGVKIAPNVSRDDGLAFAREAMAGPYAPPEQTLQMTKSGRYICAVYLSSRFGQLITPRMVRDLCFEQPSNSIQIAPFLRNLLAPYPNLLQKPVAAQIAAEQLPTSNLQQFSGTLVSVSLKGLLSKMDSLIEWLEGDERPSTDIDPDFKDDVTCTGIPSYAWHSRYLPPQPLSTDWTSASLAGTEPPPPMLVDEGLHAQLGPVDSYKAAECSVVTMELDQESETCPQVKPPSASSGCLKVCLAG